MLDADEDVLININMLDDERYKKNNEIKKQKPGYQAFEDQEVDELTGMPKTRSLLAKYDSEIDGDQKSSFVIGESLRCFKYKQDCSRRNIRSFAYLFICLFIH